LHGQKGWEKKGRDPSDLSNEREAWVFFLEIWTGEVAGQASIMVGKSKEEYAPNLQMQARKGKRTVTCARTATVKKNCRTENH